jgi:2-haloacid dehalogenase
LHTFTAAMIKRPKVVLLDVYETLLDMSEVERRVNLLLDSKRGYMIWFELFMEYCFVDNCTVQFNDFSSIARATLMMAAKKLDTSVNRDNADDLLELLKQLPVNEGVQEGLSQLNEQNFRIAALTNASEKTVRRRMELTGLISYFEAVLSAEHVKKYKPCCEVYQWAAEKLDTPLDEILMVSAHGWDIAGAANAGMQTAYLNQRKEMLYPLAPKPDYTESSLVNLCMKLQMQEIKSAK